MVKNARCLAAALAAKGYGIVSGGTDTHVFLLDLRAKVIMYTIQTDSGREPCTSSVGLVDALCGISCSDTDSPLPPSLPPLLPPPK